MTYYYDPQRALLLSALAWKATTFKVIFWRFEFWLYLSLHTACVLIFQLTDVRFGDFPFEATTPVSFFMIFMIIFYNGQCYDRYLDFYENCMTGLHAAVYFVHELCISFHYAEVEQHKFTAARFIIGAIFLFYMNVTGGMPSRNEWNEVLDKGLLLPAEVRILQEYPGGRVTLVLTNWALRAVQIGLQKDCFHQEHAPHIGHLHNRISEHVHTLVTSCNRISYLLALPVPFPYFHLLNIVLNCNFAILAIGLATFKMYSSIVAYAFALLVFMGIREVSVSLADPFGVDDVDFPVQQFLDHLFNDAIGLLEAFSNPEVHMRVMEQIPASAHFTDRQLLHQIKEEMLYEKGYHLNRDNPFAWDRLTPMQYWKGKAGLKDALWSCLAEPFDPKSPPRPKRSEEEGVHHANAFHLLGKEDEVDYQIMMNEQEEIRGLRLEVSQAHSRIEELRQQMGRLSSSLPITPKGAQSPAEREPSRPTVLGSLTDNSTWTAHLQVRPVPSNVASTTSSRDRGVGSRRGGAGAGAGGPESFEVALSRIRTILHQAGARTESNASSRASSAQGVPVAR